MDTVDFFENYPQPTESEWLDCQKVVSDNGEDVDDAYILMGEYEMRLHKAGIPTNLAVVLQPILTAANEVGLPLEHLADALNAERLMKKH